MVLKFSSGAQAGLQPDKFFSPNSHYLLLMNGAINSRFTLQYLLLITIMAFVNFTVLYSTNITPSLYNERFATHEQFIQTRVTDI